MNQEQSATQSPKRRARRGQRGQSLVEFALTVPLFFVLIFAIVDFGLGLRAWITITNSAREGARYAVVSCATDSPNETAVKQVAVDKSAGLLTLSDVTVTNCPGDSTEDVAVRVDYTYNLITPLGGFLSLLSGGSLPSSLNLSSTSNMRLE